MAPADRQERDFEHLPLRLAYDFLEENGFGPEALKIRLSQDRLGSYTSSVRRAKIIALLRENNLLTKFIEENWPFGATPAGKTRINRYDNIYAKYTNTHSGPTGLTDQQVFVAGKEFTLEEQLRDYLAENLELIEPGLMQWPLDNGDAVEFELDDHGPSRRIDILAKDKAGLPVIIELKVSRGHERTVGQALYYRARVKELFGAARVRIFIVAGHVSPQLRAAAKEVPDVGLFGYSLAVSISKLDSIHDR